MTKTCKQQIAGWFACLVIVIPVLVFRKGNFLGYPQLWAEDGLIFFYDAWMSDGFVFFKPYSGYIHFFPRVWAFIGDSMHLSLHHIAGWYVWGWLLVYGWYIALVFARIPAVYWKKFLLALLPVIIPVAGESLLNLANAHWILAMACIVTWAGKKPSPAGRWADILLMILTGLSSPHILILLPCVGWYIYKHKAWKSLADYGYIISVMAVCGIQLFFMMQGGTQRDAAHGWPDFPMIVNFFTGIFFVPWGGLVLLKWPLLVKVCMVLAVLGLLTWMAVVKKNPAVFVFLLSFFAASLVVIIALKGSIALTDPIHAASRYYFLPCWAFFAIVLLHDSGKKGIEWAKPVLLCIPVFLHLPYFKAVMLPEWDYKRYETLLDSEPLLVIPASPPGFNIIIDRTANWKQPEKFPHLFHQAFEFHQDIYQDDKAVLVVAGWICNVSLREFAASLVVLGPNDTLRFPASRVFRPDVAAHFQNPACDSSGVEWTISKTSVAYGQYPVLIEVTDSSGFYWKRLPFNMLSLP